jgi:homoserine dehydrogenase
MAVRRTERRRLALAGYGAVARALVALLEQAADELAVRYAVSYDVTAVATRRRGLVADAGGVDLGRLVAAPHPTSGPWAGAGPGQWADLVTFLADPAAPYDILVEVTTQAPADGEPAAGHIRAALASGRDVVTANKGPVAWHEAELRRLAAASGARLRYEAALMDCLPTHAIRETLLPVGRVERFAGIVNATSNAILTAMAEGRSAAEALAEAQRAGQAEADPRNDTEGHDAALKATILANLLLDPREPITPDRVERRGLEAVPDAWPAQAVARAARVRLVARGERLGEGSGDGVRVRVGPEELPLADSLAAVGGTSMALRVTSEYGGDLQLTLLGAPVQATAYAILMDLVALERLARG